MVRIIDGEVVQDNDPRLQQRAPAASPAQRPPQQPQQQRPPQQAGGFNFNAPPFRLDGGPPGLLGLPDVVIFGQRFVSAILAGGLGLGLFFGWKGLFGGYILYYIYQANGGPPAPAPAPAGGPARHGGAAQSGAAAAAASGQQAPPGGDASGMDFLQRYIQGPTPPGRRPPAAGGASSGAAPGQAQPSSRGPTQQQQDAPPTSASPGGAFSGRSYKLGS